MPKLEDFMKKVVPSTPARAADIVGRRMDSVIPRQTPLTLDQIQDGALYVKTER